LTRHLSAAASHFYPEFGRISGASRRKPGFPLVSFLPAAKKDTASIPCAFAGRNFFPNVIGKGPAKRMPHLLFYRDEAAFPLNNSFCPIGSLPAIFSSCRCSTKGVIIIAV
jgi:hypothetical protein